MSLYSVPSIVSPSTAALSLRKPVEPVTGRFSGKRFKKIRTVDTVGAIKQIKTVRSVDTVGAIKQIKTLRTVDTVGAIKQIKTLRTVDTVVP